MKTLFLIRHAKSSWTSSELNDFDRPLNERGNKDAPQMARRLLDHHVEIDLFVSSPAKRAKTTALLFMKEFKSSPQDLVLIQALYDPDAQAFYQVIGNLDNSSKRVALFSHNPAITNFVNSLTEVQLDNMPTCAVFGVGAQVESWKDFAGAPKDFLFFDYPKSERLA
jgi:phosphohistidine phosphatase